MWFNWEKIRTSKAYLSTFSDRERLATYEKLQNVAWTTWDYKAIEQLEDLLAWLDADKQQAIKDGKRKMIVLVSTDWESYNARRLRKAIENLRKKWVIVVWLWITTSGWSVVENYASSSIDQWTGVVCERIEHLPATIFTVLEPHLLEL